MQHLFSVKVMAIHSLFLRVPVSNCHRGPLLVALDLGHMIIPES